MSHSDDRRRRLLSEESASPEPVRARSSSSAGPPPGYSDAARRQHQPHITDLVPLRGWVHAVLFLVGALTIAAVVSAYWFVPEAVEGRWPLLDVSRDGSLAAWLGSVLLGAAAPLALVLYAVRRHRLDDYRGRYRMWLYAAPVFLWLSLEQTAALRETVREGLQAATGWSFFAAESLYWTLTLAATLGLLGVRLAVETRRCRVSTAGVVLALLLAYVGIATELGWLGGTAVRTSTAVLVALQLSAALVLLSSLGVFARHVILAAEGRLTVRVKKPRGRGGQSESDADSSGDAGAKKRLAAVAKVDPPHALKGPLTARTDLAAPAASPRPAVAARPLASAVPARTQSASAENARAVATGDEAGPRKLSKAERKALKRQRMADDEQDDWWERGD